MLKSSLCDYSDAKILAKGTIAMAGAEADAAARQVEERSKQVMFKNSDCINCITRINNLQAANAKDLDVVIPIYNLIECIDYYSKASGILWQYCREEPNATIPDSESF